jgi:hypothetical protein
MVVKVELPLLSPAADSPPPPPPDDDEPKVK